MNPAERVSLNPQPIPPGRVELYRALGDLVFAAFLDADGPSGDVDPLGPGGPVMRQIVLAAGISQVASALDDESLRNEAHELAARIAADATRRVG